MSFTGLAPDGVTATKIGIDFVEQAFGDEGLDHLVRGTTLEPGRQWQRQHARSLRCGAENNKLGVG